MILYLRMKKLRIKPLMKITAKARLTGSASMKQMVEMENLSPWGGEAKSFEIPSESRILQAIIEAKKKPTKKSSMMI